MSEQAVKGLGAGAGDGEWAADFQLTESGARHSLFKVLQADGSIVQNLAYPTGVTAAVSSGGSLTAATTYYYVVSALNVNGETIPSAEVSGLTTSANKTITVDWTDVPGALSYNIYRSTASQTYGASTLLGNILPGVSTLVDNGSTYSTGSGTPVSATTAHIKSSAAFPANALGRVYSLVTAGGVATATGTGAQILATTTLPAGCLSALGQGVKIRAWGSTAANTNTKTMALTFGATTVASCTGATSGAKWYLEAEVYRNAATTQVAIGNSEYVATWAQTQSTPAETLANAIACTFTATDGTSSASDIVMAGFVVELVG